MSPTKVQPGRNAKSHHQMIKAPCCNQDATAGDEADVPCLARHSSQGMMVEECEQQFLNSFHAKMVTLNNGQQLHPCVALQQLHAGLISKDEIVEHGDCDEALPCKSPVGENTCDKSVVPIPPMDESTSPNANMDSETEE
ncbi:hypothetical protein EDD16DRAFT_1713399 [Pisolithus croceorrhizus]|nr:hypothetical protein EDD16DRAFT_1713399 [Pisolithus croceorrhizus]